MIQEVKPKVLLPMYAAYIHIRGGFEAPPKTCYESHVDLDVFARRES
jgi:hypothetical protein